MRVSGDAQIGSGVGLAKLTIGNGAGYTGVVLNNSAGFYSWLLGSQYNYSNTFEITPSTTIGGTTFTTSVFRITNTGAATFASSVTANATSTFSSSTSLSAIFSNGGAVSNFNSIEIRGGTAGTAVNWQISKDNTVGNAFQITPSTTNGGTTYTTPSLTILNTGAATFSSSVSATSVTAGGRTILAGSYIADLSGSGNDTGIAFGAGAIFSVNGSGASATKNIGSSANPWGNLWAGAATFSSSVTAGAFIPSGATIPTNGMYLPAADSIALSTTSTQRFRITSGGNIVINSDSIDNGTRFQVIGTGYISSTLGVGTLATYKLDVLTDGDNGIRTTSSAGQQLYLGNSAGTGVVGTLNNYSLGIITNSSIRATIDTNGNFGIGVSPSYKLHVSNNANSPLYIGATNTTAGNASAAGLLLTSNTASGSAEYQKRSSTATTYKTLSSNDLAIFNTTAGDITLLNDHINGKIEFAAGGASTPQITIDSAGRLLIGTTASSTYKLDVVGDARVSGSMVINTDTLFVDSGTQRVGIGTVIPSFGLHINTTGGSATGIGVTSDTANDTLYYGSGTVTGSVTLIDGYYNATGSILNKLTNTNTSTGSSILSISVAAASTGDPYVRFSTNGIGATDWSIGIDNSDSDKFKIGYYQSPSTGSLATFTTTGRLGIGTESPAEALDVAGAIKTASGGHLGYFTGSSAIFTNAVSYGSATGFSITHVSESGLTFGFGSSQLLVLDGSGGMSIPYTNGLKIGTLTSQKIGFWNATPIVQPTTSVASATRTAGGGNTVTDSDTFDGYTIAKVVKALRDTGILA
jgi:hypothetical protein